jgi:hypothetical protein
VQRGTWQCKGLGSGTVFKNIEFEEGEWFDYDEKVGAIYTFTSFTFLSDDLHSRLTHKKANVPVSVTEIETKIDRA